MGALGAFGVAGLTVPFGRGTGVAAKDASELSDRNMPKPYAAAFLHSPVLGHTRMRDGLGEYRLYTVTEKAATARILPGLSTQVYGYNGLVPGPTIKVPQGERVKLRVRNQLPATNPLSRQPFNTSTHLHGSASLPQFDGYANDVSQPGKYKDYHYPNWQPARTLWYHDHNVHTTAQNAYAGLAAQYHITDGVEVTRGLPQGSYDIPVTITDAMFNANGSLAYDDHSESGLWGDIILVNGVPWPTLKVKPKIYRFRVIVASIARSYRFRLSNGAPMHMVATDGGLMPRTQSVASYRHGGAERYEFLIDFSKFAPGTTINLTNSSNDNNIDYDHTDKIMRFVVADPATLPADAPGSWTPSTVPGDLASSEAMSLQVSQATNKFTMRLERTNSNFVINGKTWHDVEASGFTSLLTNPKPDEVGLWTIQNNSGGWFHPLHIHLVDFQIVSRNGRPPAGYEKGPKDVVYVGEGETVQLLMKFSLNARNTTGNAGGRYMVHCHNLPHEDHDMMHQFAVGDPKVNDPINSAPSKPDDGRYDDGIPA